MLKLDFSILDRAPQKTEPTKIKAPAPILDFSIFARLDAANAPVMPVMKEISIDELKEFLEKSA